MTAARATSTWTSACGTSACEMASRRGPSSSGPPWHHHGLHPLERRVELVSLDCAGRIDVLRADLRALAHERAPPDTLVGREHLQPFPSALVARIEVVPLRERDGRRPDELWIEPVYRAGRVAEHAVDAHAERLVRLELLRGLQILTVGHRLVGVAHQPRLHGHQLPQEIADVDDEVADDRKIS